MTKTMRTTIRWQNKTNDLTGRTENQNTVKHEKQETDEIDGQFKTEHDKTQNVTDKNPNLSPHSSQKDGTPLFKKKQQFENQK